MDAFRQGGGGVIRERTCGSRLLDTRKRGSRCELNLIGNACAGNSIPSEVRSAVVKHGRSRRRVQCRRGRSRRVDRHGARGAPSAPISGGILRLHMPVIGVGNRHGRRWSMAGGGQFCGDVEGMTAGRVKGCSRVILKLILACTGDARPRESRGANDSRGIRRGVQSRRGGACRINRECARGAPSAGDRCDIYRTHAPIGDAIRKWGGRRVIRHGKAGCRLR